MKTFKNIFPFYYFGYKLLIRNYNYNSFNNFFDKFFVNFIYIYKF